MATPLDRLNALRDRGEIVVSGRAFGGPGRSYATLDGRNYAYTGRGRMSQILTRAVDRAYHARPPEPVRDADGVFVFRDARGHPVATPAEGFPAQMTRTEANALARRNNLTVHQPPQGVEPYASPWGSPVLLVIGGVGGQRLSQRRDALAALVAAGGQVMYQSIDTERPEGAAIVSAQRAAWKHLPRGALRGALTVDRLAALDRSFEAIRDRHDYQLSASFLLTVAPPPPGPAPGLNELGRLRQTGSRSICVLQRAIEVLDKPRQGRPPSARLLEQRAQAVAKWTARLEASGGFSLAEDRAEFERDLRVTLVPHDVADTGVFDRRGPVSRSHADKGAPIHFLAHNGHAFEMPCGSGGALRMPPPTESATFAVLGPNPSDFDRARESALLEAVSGLDQPGIVFELGESFVVAREGASTVYRPAAAEAELLESAALFAGGNPERLARLQEAAKLHPGTPGGWRFRQWANGLGLRQTPFAFREAWRAAQHEAHRWQAAEPLAERRVSVLDMRAAYLAHDARKTRAAGGAADLVARFGWPGGRMLRAAAISPPEQVGLDWWGFDGVCGAVRLVSWRIPDAVPECIAADVGGHLQRGWITLPDLYDLLQAGELADVEADLLSYDADPLQAIKFPTRCPASVNNSEQAYRAYAERCEGVQGVGRCVSSGGHRERRLYLTDEAEGRAIAHALQAADKSATWAAGPDGRGCWISFDSGGGQPHEDDNYGPLRAFVLGYHAVATRRALRRFAPGQVIRVATDSVHYRGDTPPGLDAGPGALWGQWRHKTEQIPADAEATQPAQRVATGAPTAGLGSDVPPAPRDPRAGVDARLVPASLSRASFTRPVLLAEGVAGGGKTSTIIRALGARGAFLPVGPSHQRRKDLEGFTGRDATTFHSAFGVEPAPPSVPIERQAAWSAARWRAKLRDGDQTLNSRLNELPKAVVIDEAGQIGAELLAPVLKELRRRGIQAFVSYGGGQLAPPSGTDPGARLKRWAAGNAHTFTHHARADCEQLRALADKMVAAASEEEKVAALVAAVPASSVETMLAEWRPGDAVLCSTHAERKALEPRLHARHLERFPNTPAQVVYRPPDIQASRRVALPDGEGLRVVKACRGDVFPVPAARLGEGPLPPEWAWATVSTVHAVQGETIQDPRKVWIASQHLAREWTAGAAYTAATRPRRLDQLRRVAG